jgi:hypothetical protein
MSCRFHTATSFTPPRPLSRSAQRLLDMIPKSNPETGDVFSNANTTVTLNQIRRKPQYRNLQSEPLEYVGDYEERDVVNDLSTHPRHFPTQAFSYQPPLPIVPTNYPSAYAFNPATSLSQFSVEDLQQEIFRRGALQNTHLAAQPAEPSGSSHGYGSNPESLKVSHPTFDFRIPGSSSHIQGRDSHTGLSYQFAQQGIVSSSSHAESVTQEAATSRTQRQRGAPKKASVLRRGMISKNQPLGVDLERLRGNYAAMKVKYEQARADQTEGRQWTDARRTIHRSDSPAKPMTKFMRTCAYVIATPIGAPDANGLSRHEYSKNPTPRSRRNRKQLEGSES